VVFAGGFCMIRLKKEWHRDFFFIGILFTLLHLVFAAFGIANLMLFVASAGIFALVVFLKKRTRRHVLA
jgi:hypothetical protein